MPIPIILAAAAGYGAFRLLKRKPKPKTVPIRGGIRLVIPKPPPSQDTQRAQKLIDLIKAGRLKHEMQLQAAKIAAIAHRPDPKSQPADILKFFKAHPEILPQEIYPEFGWWRNQDSHKETIFRAEYDLSSGDHVSWWINTDGSVNYNHTWGGFDLGRTLQDLGNDFNSLIGGMQSLVRDVTDNAIVNMVPWQDIADYVEAATSNVPGLGTAVADIIATGEVALNVLKGGNLLEQAIRAAYAYALASTPDAAALRTIPGLDAAVDLLIHLAVDVQHPTQDMFKTAIDNVQDTPNIGGLSPRSIVASLAALIMQKLNIKD